MKVIIIAVALKASSCEEKQSSKIFRNWVQCSVGEEAGREWGMKGGKESGRASEGGGGREKRGKVTEWWQRERAERCVCQDCVCLCARVPRRRQTLAALSELTGPSPLPLLVAQGGRAREGEKEGRNGRHCLSAQFKTHDVVPFCAHIQAYILPWHICIETVFACWHAKTTLTI